MKRAFVAAAIVLVTRAATAQSIAVAGDGSFVVAHDGVIERYASNRHDRLWRTTGIPDAGAVVVGAHSVAVLDPIRNRAVVADLATGAATQVETGETPVDGAFIGANLYLLERDARTLERIEPDGTRARIPVAADSAFLRVAGDALLVYARAAGSILRITTNPFAVARNIAVAPFASDFEADGETAYTVYPREGVIRLTDLKAGKALGSIRVGAVPVDLAFASGGTALTAPTLAVADPSAKRVWIVERKQSFMQALGRGFVRGLLGLGLHGGGDSTFETSVDRVVSRGTHWAAYDSSSGTLYSFSSKKSAVVARGVAPRAFAVVDGAIVWWQNGTLVAQTVSG